MQVDGDGNGFLQSLDQGIGVHGQEKVRHILDADGISAHLLQLLGQLYEIGLVVNGGDGVGQGGLHLAAIFLCGLYGLLQVAYIVQSVENTDDVDAVFNGFATEGIYHIVGIVLVAQDILAPEEHLQLGVGQTLF